MSALESAYGSLVSGDCGFAEADPNIPFNVNEDGDTPPAPPLVAFFPFIPTPPPSPPGPLELAFPPPPTQASNCPFLKRNGVLITSSNPAITYSVFAIILSLRYVHPPFPPEYDP